MSTASRKCEGCAALRAEIDAAREDLPNLFDHDHTLTITMTDKRGTRSYDGPIADAPLASLIDKVFHVHALRLGQIDDLLAAATRMGIKDALLKEAGLA